MIVHARVACVRLRVCGCVPCVCQSGDRHFNVFSAAPENTRATPEANVPDYFL